MFAIGFRVTFSTLLLIIIACSESPAPDVVDKAESVVIVDAAKPNDDALNNYFEQIEKLMAVSYQRLDEGEEDTARGSLKSAYGIIQQAKNIDANHQRLVQAVDTLEQKYLSMIEASAEDRAYHRAEGFIDDSLKMDINKEHIQLAQEKMGKEILKKARMLDRL